MADAAKPSLGRRLQRSTTKLFSWGHRPKHQSNSQSPAPPQAQDSHRHVRQPPATTGGFRARTEGNHTALAAPKTVQIKHMRSRSVPDASQGEESQRAALGATKRVAAGVPTKPRGDSNNNRKNNNEGEDVEDETASEGSSKAGSPPRIGKEDLARNKVKLLDVGYASVVGSQDHDNEDRLLLRSNEHFHLLSVMDGHGGALAGKFVVDRLFQRLEKVFDDCQGFPDEPENDQALVQMMHDLDEEFCRYARRQSDFSGVCVLAVILFFDSQTDSAQKLVLNLGDCRVILREAVEATASRSALGARVMALSTDHCASNPIEKVRICENGGVVRFGRVAGLLEPSRSIGDIDMKEPEMKNWVIATPEIRRRELAVGRSLLILATDGVWGVLSNEKVMKIALEALAVPRGKRRKGANSAANNAVRAIVEAARQRGSIDDISVIVTVV